MSRLSWRAEAAGNRGRLVKRIVHGVVCACPRRGAKWLVFVELNCGFFGAGRNALCEADPAGQIVVRIQRFEEDLVRSRGRQRGCSALVHGVKRTEVQGADTRLGESVRQIEDAEVFIDDLQRLAVQIVPAEYAGDLARLVGDVLCNCCA